MRQFIRQKRWYGTKKAKVIMEIMYDDIDDDGNEMDLSVI